MLPQFEVSLAFSAGPFEDAAGGAFAHFDGSKHGVLTPAKQVLETKKDLLTSVVKVLRDCVRHCPALVVGDGQGALVVLALTRPLLVETALAARNVQREEVEEIARAWGNILGTVVRNPRLGKAKVGKELFRLAAPEVFDEFTEPSLHVVGLMDRN
jgi:hypothetical protein